MTTQPDAKTVDMKFMDWVMTKQRMGETFTDDQMQLLRMIRSHVEDTGHITRDTFFQAPFNAHGGLARMWALFGEQMTDEIIKELDAALAA